MNRPRGFTLVELLVVMAILALLTGILLPVFAKVRASALAAKCVSNMRNLQMAHWMYIQANDGWFIDVGLEHGGAHGNEGVAWINTLQEYYDSPLLLRSPADNSPHWPADQGGMGVPIPGTSDTFRRTSYGVNNFLSRSVPADPIKVYDRLHTIKNHVQTVHFVIMAMEGEFAGADHPHVENWFVPGNPGASPVLAANQVAIGLHGGKPKSGDAVSNYGFLDGHVETVKFSEVYVTPEMNRFDPAVAHLFAVRKAMRR